MARDAQDDSAAPPALTRRDVLRGAALASAASSTGILSCSPAGGRGTSAGASRQPAPGPVVRNGRIRQAICGWPYMVFGDKWDLPRLCQAARDLGVTALDLFGPAEWPTLQQAGLTCAVSVNGMPDPPFMKGLNNPRYQEDVISRTRQRIEECARAKIPNVIAFTGFQWRDAENPASGAIPADEGAANTVKGLKALAGDAERHGVTIVLEHLNSRVTGHDFKGHPGYQGDHIDYCAEIIRRVGSPRVKLLFDIYHVQIMDGDVIARIREYGTDLIGHVHTAGVPGRGELDATQELQYAPIMQALLDIGYTGHVAQEFIPTRPAMDGLTEAVRICDI
jgi:hydroxypyruvate isomerase